MALIWKAENSLLTTFWVILGLGTIYWVSKCAYNLLLHPLRGFPGPKLAALGSEYEFYYDVVKDGRYLWKIKEMHRTYGPIIRVNADELHIDDSQYYDRVYAGTSRRVNKWPPMAASYTVPESSVATVDHDLHRLRRSMMSPYFSKAAIVRLEPMIHERIGRLSGRLEECMRHGEIVNLDSAFSALAADIATYYFFGTHIDNLGRPGFTFPLKEAIVGLAGAFHLTRFMPRLVAMLKKLPYWIIGLVQPGIADLLRWQQELEDNIEATQGGGVHKSSSVIIGALRDPEIPAEQKTVARLVDEGMVILIAGSETTARTISNAIYHLLENRTLLRRLREELSTLPPRPCHEYSHTELEPLAFLSGVVNEALRLSYGILMRLPRVAIHETLQYKNYEIPPGTPVSLSPYLVHMDPSIFPDPSRFEPERWIKAAQEGVHLNKFLVNFTKGSRQCLGINLAYAEIYMTIARVASSFDLELCDARPEDLELYRARIVGYPRKGLGEVRVRVTGRAADC